MSSRVLTLLAVLGTVVLVGYGTTMLTYIPSIMPRKIRNGLAIDGPRALRYQSWRNSTELGVDTYYRWNLFNVTNAPKVMAGEEMPILDDVGPFVFKLVKWRPERFTSWWPNGTLRYANKWRFEFVPSMSTPSSLDVNITTANFGLLGLLLKGGTSDFYSDIIDKVLPMTGEQYFGTRTAGELLYGYKDETLEAVKTTFCSDVLMPDSFIWSLCEWLLDGGQALPVSATIAISPNNEFDENNTVFDEIYSGGPASTTTVKQPSYTDALSYTMWQNNRSLGVWSTPEANVVNGTDGTAFHPGLQEGETIYAFVGALKRTVPLCYHGKSRVHDLDAFDFRICSWAMDNMTVNPNNKGFGMTERGIMNTPPSLLLPYFNSQPYFYDDETTNVRVSLPPMPPVEYLTTNIHVEPVSGQTIKARKALQVNTHMRPYFLHNRNVPVPLTAKLMDTYLPVAWMNEWAELSAQTDALLFDHLLLPGEALMGSGIAALVVAGLLVIAVAYRCLRKPPVADKLLSVTEEYSLSRA
jgi:lysosome membrane protein 2